MLKLCCHLLLCLFSVSLYATELPLDRANIDISDQATLQRGAKVYMNYCAACHSLRYMRYSKMANDLGLVTDEGNIDTDLLFNNLVFTQSKVGEPIINAMSKTDARQWFGVAVPDLSLIARVRGADWLYTYLTSFYRDDARPFGSNNRLFPDVAMPNILEPLQGEQIAVYAVRSFDFNGHKKEQKVISHLQTLGGGEMSSHQFKSAVNDVVNFLVYVAEPDQLQRQAMGVWVLIFLGILLVLAIALKRIYWRKIH